MFHKIQLKFIRQNWKKGNATVWDSLKTPLILSQKYNMKKLKSIASKKRCFFNFSCQRMAEIMIQKCLKILFPTANKIWRRLFHLHFTAQTNKSINVQKKIFIYVQNYSFILLYAMDGDAQDNKVLDTVAPSERTFWKQFSPKENMR